MAHAGIAHKYSKRHIAFEHGPSIPVQSSDPPNTLLFIGGLTDGLLTVPYPTSIAASLPSSWVLAEVLLSSSYKGWTTGNLARDVRELGECVAYFKKLRSGKKVVLLGHSTGCQDIMEYLTGGGAAKRPGIDGAILQGGVSDREAVTDMLGDEEAKQKFTALLQHAKELIETGKQKDMMPIKDNAAVSAFGSPATAYRTYSLLAPGGDDDFFSSDLSDKQLTKTFGKIPKTTPVCILVGEKDPYIPAHIDRVALVQRWTKIIREGGGVVDDVNGGIVKGASHNLDGNSEEVVQDLVGRVCRFLGTLEEGAASRL